MGKLKNFWREIVIFLSILGPGLITANVDNDAGGITTYSVAGAHFGFSMLWAFVPIIIALIVIQEMSSRMAVVTGKGLADLIREEFGVKITFYAMLGLVYSNVFNTIAEFAGIAASADLLGINKYAMVLGSAVFVWFLIVKGTYKSIEKIFLIFCFFYVAYVISAFYTKPDWHQVARDIVRPQITWSREYLLLLIAVIGTTITPWMQFYQQSSVVEKGIKLADYKYSKLDVICGAFVVNIVAFFIVLVCANTLFKSGIRIETARDAALALRPLADNWSYYLFAVGLFNASLFAACILPLSTAYCVCEGMGWEQGVNKKFREAPQFYTLYTITIAIAALVVLMPNIKLVPLMISAQTKNGILLPFVLIFMLLLVNNKRLMGQYTNSRIYNIIAITTVVLLIGMTIVLLVTSLMGIS
ncbi:MAG TPA: Nramp family divalent metal transporter [Candidatus Omnitrophota bacterium]|nr:Nramp family divalent metal transporter [Candidatus Omnitrophota bacterium]HRZ14891.1 Nramp family divalent metal transporter [Candidatus Omnitrophota bacterium]